MKQFTKYSLAILALTAVVFMTSCKKKDSNNAVISSFSYTADATDFLKIHFTNESQNYSSLSWNFGDASAASTEVNPVHAYPAAGVYTVVLTATGGGGTDSYSVSITVSDPNQELTKLAGSVSKTWKLLRVTSTGRYPLEVGPIDHSTIWWAMGLGNNEIANRPCMLNDEWTFGRDGSLKYDPKGDYWAEGGVFTPDNICAATTTMVGPNGEDLSAWGGGNFTYVYTAGAVPTLKSVGMGSFIGFFKLGNDAETKVPLASVTYNIVKLTDGAVDTLVIEGNYHSADPTFAGGYWRFTLMHYDNAADEPPIPGPSPTASFTYAQNGMAITFTNTSVNGVTYAWDFGDGQTSTSQNPVHTYAAEGIYTISMTATNPNGSATASTVIFLSNTVLTEAMLQGAAWKVRAEEKCVFVGSGLGKSDWWSLPKSNLISGTGADDWTCMPDDQFTFAAGGVFTYATMGTARNDGYMGAPNGCWDDAAIAASGNGAMFGSGTHSYVFTPAAGGTNPIITLTNGAGKAAFLGFYKGYYGGENTAGANPPNGGNPTNKYEVIAYANSGTHQYLLVSVDISAGHDGSAAWSVILER
ncbi:MAG: PKD domain-containing protein [Bacteroidota bacterium]